MVTGGLISFKNLVNRWVSPAIPCHASLKRGFAQERPIGNPTTNLRGKDPLIGEKLAAEGAPASQQTQHVPKTAGQENTDSEGQILTPSLIKAKTTQDLLNSVREERLRTRRAAKKDVDAMKLEETFKKGAGTADPDSR